MKVIEEIIKTIKDQSNVYQINDDDFINDINLLDGLTIELYHKLKLEKQLSITQQLELARVPSLELTTAIQLQLLQAPPKLGTYNLINNYFQEHYSTLFNSFKFILDELKVINLQPKDLKIFCKILSILLKNIILDQDQDQDQDQDLDLDLDLDQEQQLQTNLQKLRENINKQKIYFKSSRVKKFSNIIISGLMKLSAIIPIIVIFIVPLSVAVSVGISLLQFKTSNTDNKAKFRFNIATNIQAIMLAIKNLRIIKRQENNAPVNYNRNPVIIHSQDLFTPNLHSNIGNFTSGELTCDQVNDQDLNHLVNSKSIRSTRSYN